jgi:TRAP-type C4-dicarboxylate transport system substrate-binding protein
MSMQTLAGRSAAVAAIAAAALAAPAAAEELSLAHFVAPAHVVTPSVIEPLVAGVAAASNGALTIRVYPGGELGPGPVEQYARAVTGVADITWGLAGNHSAQFPLSMIVELPGVVDAAGAGYKAIWRAWDAGLLTNEFPGTVPLALWTSEPSIFIFNGRAPRTPAEFAGLKIRVSGAFPGRVIEALGAIPVQINAGEMYNALQTGLIDGIMTGPSAIADFKLDEVADTYIEGASLGHILFYLVMNKPRYDGLAPELRAALDANIGPSLSALGEAGWNAKSEATLERLRADPNENVIMLTPDEIAAFNAITIGLTDRVIADLDARGLPGSQTRAVMQGQ